MTPEGPIPDELKPRGPLRRGWTTGACATAAAKAAYAALLHGSFPDPVSIALPNGAAPSFALAEHQLGDGVAGAGVVKDAGDDPDVTHGALVRAEVRLLAPGSGVRFQAGPGVGTVTRPGLPLPPGEPAINPGPRRMIEAALASLRPAPDALVTVSIPGGEALALQTLNGRLGIVGGLSVLGTTGIVVPYSCAAWIDSIRRGIDVARAIGLEHVAGSTGRTSEAAIQRLHGLPETALIEMGDFAGGMLKYLRRHPVPRISIAGGIGKITKLAQGRLDLHSGRGGVDRQALAGIAAEAAVSAATVARIAGANTAAEALAMAREDGIALGDRVAADAWQVAAEVLGDLPVTLEIVLFDAQGAVSGRASMTPVRNRRT
nr:cobalt-precorrin-5B (C(1))-methyltransferase [uncultured Lichenicoccus sp.]